MFRLWLKGRLKVTCRPGPYLKTYSGNGGASFYIGLFGKMLTRPVGHWRVCVPVLAGYLTWTCLFTNMLYPRSVVWCFRQEKRSIKATGRWRQSMSVQFLVTCYDSVTFIGQGSTCLQPSTYALLRFNSLSSCLSSLSSSSSSFVFVFVIYMFAFFFYFFFPCSLSSSYF